MAEIADDRIIFPITNVLQINFVFSISVSQRNDTYAYLKYLNVAFLPIDLNHITMIDLRVDYF